MIDNKLYAVLRHMLKIESHYYQAISVDAGLDVLLKSNVSKNDLDGAFRALISGGYILATDDSGYFFYITPKAHATVEEFRRTRFMFWLPTIISIASFLIAVATLITNIIRLSSC